MTRSLAAPNDAVAKWSQLSTDHLKPRHFTPRRGSDDYT